ncbi:MAG TPA: hypothetical protein VGO55_07125 [Allosphingosinicella sp.]|jgi:hypothetical protein|nr:hypothetical protein [Allosphingosinicella sp.]
MIRWLVSLLLTVGLGVAPTEGARPGVVAMYEAGESYRQVGVMIWADDRGRVRAGIGIGHGGMMFLTRDTIGYAVIDDGPNGSVGRQEDMLALMIAGAQGPVNRGIIERLARQRVEIARAGTERIAGVTGDVYRLTFIDDETRAPPFEIVISAEPRLAPVGRELLRFYDSLRAPLLAVVGSAPQPYVAVRELLARGTPLRFGGMRLQSVESRPLTDEMVALPGPVLSHEAFTEFLTTGPMRADDPMAGEDGSYNGTYPSVNAFDDANYSDDFDEAVNEHDPE